MTTSRAKTASEATPETQELERLRQQVATLQADAERRDAEEGQAPAYEQLGAGTGHLEERLARVTGHVSRIPKRGRNAEQNYMFVAHSDVLDAIRPALAAEGVQFRSRITQTEAEAELVAGGAERRTSGGMVWRMWRVEVAFTFACWHDEKRCEQTTEGWPGYAQDYSDKGASKALTSAIKTFLIQQFLVSTGDDPDEPTRAPAGEQQRSEARSTDPTANEVRLAARACMEWNEKLPQGVLGKIARKLTGEGRVMKINDAAQLAKIARAAEKYMANPEGGEAWLSGDAQQASGEPQPEETQRQEAAGEPEAPVHERDLSQPLTAAAGDTTSSSEDDAYPPGGEGRDALPADPVTLPPADSYDPPLTEEEARQHALGLNPRPSYSAGDDEDTPF